MFTTNKETHMKRIAIVVSTMLAALGLAGCVAVPYEGPVVYASPAPTVIVRPAYRGHFHHHRYRGGHRW